jgi:outer membrane receptor protein involved in Fe transport
LVSNSRIGRLPTAIACALAFGSSAAAQDLDFDLARLGAAAAIQEFGRQARVQILVNAAELPRGSLGPVRGRLEVRAALERLIQNTNLQIVSVSGNTYVLGAKSNSDRSEGRSAASQVAAPTAARAPRGADLTAPEPSEVDAVVVTGSRIIRNGYGYAAPTPMTVAPVAQMAATTPSNIADGLNKLPQFNGSVLQSDGSASTGVAGNFLNLRSIGINRTLILVDGRRVPPSNFSGQVDINSIPQLLIQRVEVVTGGASAVYGSDAVTGVVNFVVDSEFQGLRGGLQTGISEFGDTPSFRFGAAAGVGLSGRGRLIWSYEHFQKGGLVHEDRSYGVARPVFVGAGTAASPYVLVDNTRISNTALGGLVTSGPFQGKQFSGDGGLAAFDPGTPTSLTNVAVGGDGAYFARDPLTAPLKTDQGFARLEYELGGGVIGYAQASVSSARTRYKKSTSLVENLTIFSGNPLLSADAQQQLTATDTPSFTVSRLSRDLNQDSVQDQLSDTGMVTVGLTGALRRFKWDLYYTRGESRFRQLVTNNIDTARYLAALDAVRAPDGSTVCNVTLTNPALYPGCAPLDVFGVDNQSAAAKAFIYRDTRWWMTNRLEDMAASLSGDLFDNWAGPISVALSAEHRRQSLVQTASVDTRPAPDLAGLRHGAVPSSTFTYSTVAPMSASNSVDEVSLETVFPLLRQRRLARSLEVNGAARYTHYSSSGPATTWKLGLNYIPMEDFRIRATLSRDIRAPTLYDLYAGSSFVLGNLTDPHTSTSRVVAITVQGNPDLVPEVSKSSTVGLVYFPSWLPRFRMSVDYYQMEITHGIGSISGSQPAILQECEASGGTARVCATIVRPFPFEDRSPANFPILVLNQSLNISQIYTHGVDVEASYRIQLSSIVSGWPGVLGGRLLYSHQPVLKSRSFPGSVLTNAAGAIGVAADRATIMVGYQAGSFFLNWATRYSGRERRSGNPLLVFSDPPVPAVTYSDITLNYSLGRANRRATVFLSVQNLFNAGPRISPKPSVNAIPGFASPIVPGDDGVGRYYTVGAKINY